MSSFERGRPLKVLSFNPHRSFFNSKYAFNSPFSLPLILVQQQGGRRTEDQSISLFEFSSLSLFNNSKHVCMKKVISKPDGVKA
jgi:hypothetical protein